MTSIVRRMISWMLVSAFASGHAIAQDRARDLGIPFEGNPGPLNAITDVAGIEVGHVTLIEGEGALVVGKGPICTGVTSIHPRGKESTDPKMGEALLLCALAFTLLCVSLIWVRYRAAHIETRTEALRLDRGDEGDDR